MTEARFHQVVSARLGEMIGMALYVHSAPGDSEPATNPIPGAVLEANPLSGAGEVDVVRIPNLHLGDTPSAEVLRLHVSLRTV